MASLSVSPSPSAGSVVDYSAVFNSDGRECARRSLIGEVDEVMQSSSVAESFPMRGLMAILAFCMEAGLITLEEAWPLLSPCDTVLGIFAEFYGIARLGLTDPMQAKACQTKLREGLENDDSAPSDFNRHRRAELSLWFPKVHEASVITLGEMLTGLDGSKLLVLEIALIFNLKDLALKILTRLNTAAPLIPFHHNDIIKNAYANILE